MIYYYVNVVDRQTHDTVTVGAMLTAQEAREIISFLQKYNATDFQIVKGIENYEISCLFLQRSESRFWSAYC